MGVKDSVINLIIRGRDLFSPAAKEAAGGAGELQAEIGKLNADLKDLGTQSKQVSKARELEIYGDMLRETMTSAQAALASMQVEMNKLPQPSAEAVSAFKRLKDETASLTERYNQNEAKLKTVQASLRSAGVDFSNLAEEEKRLRVEAASLGDALAKLKGVKESAAKIDELRTNVALAKTEYERTTNVLKSVAIQMEATTKPTQSLKDAHALAKQEASRASIAYQKLSRDLEQHEAALNSVGISSKDVGNIERDLATRITELQIRISELNKTQKEIGSNNVLAAQMEKQKAELLSTKSALEMLQTEFEQSNTAQREFGTRVAEAAKNAGIATRAFEQNEAKLQAMRTQLDQAGVDAKDLATAQGQLATATANASARLAEKQTKLQQVKAELSSASQGATGFTRSIGGLTSQLIAFASTYIGIRSVTSAIKDMFSAGDQAEQLQIQMNAVMGSIEEGEKATAWIQKFAKDTPLQVNEVTTAFTTLKNFGLNPMDGTLQAVVDQSYKLGKGFEGVQRISLALGQAWAKQKLQGDEILQLIEAGVPVWDMLAKVTGKNTGELQKLSEQGQLGRDVIKDLMDEIGRSSSGAAAANMGTLSGLISNAKDNIDLFYRTVSESGAMDWLKKQISDLNTEFSQMAKDGRLKKYAQEVSDWIVTTGESAKNFVLNISGSFDGIINGTMAVVQTFRIAFNTFTWAIKTSIAAAMLPLVAFAKMLDGLAGAAEAIGLDGLANKLKFTSGAIKAEFDAFAKAGAEDLDDIADASEKMAGTHSTSSNQMKKNMQDVQDKSAETAEKIKKDNNATQESFENTADKIKKAFSKEGLDLEQASGGIGSAIAENIETLKLIENQAGVTGNAISQFLAKAFSSTKNKAEIDALINEMDLLHQQGRLVGNDYTSSLGAAAAAAKTLSATNAEGAQLQTELLKKQKEEIKNVVDGIEKQRQAGTLAGDDLIKAYSGVANTAGEFYKTNNDGAQLQIDILTKQKQAVDEAYRTTPLEKYKTQSAQLQTQIEALVIAQNKATQSANEQANATEKQGSAATAAETALESMGIKSSAALKKAADEAEANFNVISTGSTTLRDQQAAFMKYAEASLTAAQATGELPPPLLSSQAAALGLSGQLDKLKTSLSSSGAAAETAAQQYDVFDYRNNRAAEGAKNVVSTYQTMTPLFKAATIDMSKASSYMSMSVEDLNKEIATQNELIGKLRHTVGVIPDAFGQWIGSINQASIKTYEFYQHAARASIVIQDLQKSLSTNPSEVLISQAERALLKYKDLGEQNLSGLRSAISSAKSQMDSLNSSVQSTLNSLRDEMDEMNNNQTAIENRRYQTQVADLEEKLAQAKAMSDKSAANDVRESMRLAQQIHNQKLANIKTEQEAAKADTASSTTSTAATETTSTASTSSKTVTVNLKTGSSATPVQVTDEAQADALIAALQQVGLRTSL